MGVCKSRSVGNIVNRYILRSQKLELRGSQHLEGGPRVAFKDGTRLCLSHPGQLFLRPCVHMLVWSSFV